MENCRSYKSMYWDEIQVKTVTMKKYEVISEAYYMSISQV